MADMVHHPRHYNIGKFEVIDVIEDWELGFCLGNTVKYVARAGHKVTMVNDKELISDLKKAFWYLTRELVSTYKVPTDVLSKMVMTIVKDMK